MTTIEQLLSLLDDEQALAVYLDENGYGDCVVSEQETTADGMDIWHKRLSPESAAALAFRLRDEAIAADEQCWYRGTHYVTVHGEPLTSTHGIPPIGSRWRERAQPKHYIVAALIAQKLKEDAK